MDLAIFLRQYQSVDRRVLQGHNSNQKANRSDEKDRLKFYESHHTIFDLEDTHYSVLVHLPSDLLSMLQSCQRTGYT